MRFQKMAEIKCFLDFLIATIFNKIFFFENLSNFYIGF